MAPAPDNLWNSINTFLAEHKALRPCESDTLGLWLSRDGDSRHDTFDTPDIPDTPALGQTHTRYPPTPSQHSVVSSSTECTRNSSVFSTTNVGAANLAHRHHYHHRGGGGGGSGGSTINSDDVPDIRELTGPERHAMHDMAAPESTATTTLRSCPMPCEFAWYTGCTATFDASTERESWIRHELEAHLGGIPPAACLCWFCDDFKFIADQTHGGDRGENFHSRMEHIAGHFRDGASVRGIRSDFFFLDHLWDGDLIQQDVFEREKARHEEVPVPGLRLKPRGYRTERMVREEERRVSVVVDTRKEERERRRAAGGQGRRRP